MDLEYTTECNPEWSRASCYAVEDVRTVVVIQSGREATLRLECDANVVSCAGLQLLSAKPFFPVAVEVRVGEWSCEQGKFLNSSIRAF